MISRAYVFIDGLEASPIICGIVELDAKGNIGKFRYGQSYLQRSDAFPLDPVHLPLLSDQFITRVNKGMFGVILDAGADSWGKKLILSLHSTKPRNDLELVLAGDSMGVGALTFSLSRTASKPKVSKNKLGDIPMLLKGKAAILNNEEISKEAKKAFGGKTVSGYPVDMNFVEVTKEFFRFYLSEWNAGKTLTAAYHLYGVDSINPHPEANYTKPILFLINELDFSGGDFMPTILKDNKRVTLLGTRTAGAGGYVIRHEFPNRLGLARFSTTGSLAERVTGDPIENLGVQPDISYELKAEDFQDDFKSYREKINKSVIGLIQ